MESHATSRVILVQTPGEPDVLVVEFIIDCPICGPQRITVAGHHLRLIRDVAVDTVDAYPELTRAKVTQVGEMQQFKARGNDPSTS